MPCTDRIHACAACSKIAASPMFWLSDPITVCGSSARMVLLKPIPPPWPMRSTPKPGPLMPREREARGSGYTIGLASACLGRAILISNDGFSSAAAGALPMNGPITSALPPPARRWPNSQAPQVRWAIEECFQRAKTDLGLDHCEARSWHGWRRHMSLVMAAAAFLAKLAADTRRAAMASGKPNKTSPPTTIAA